MRAVNLIPAGGGRDGRGGRSVGPWGVLGVLGLLLVGVIAYVLTNNQIAERRAQLTSLQTQVQAIQAKADAARPYKEFAALAQARVQTIRQLGAARFDWQRAFGDLARVIPSDVALSGLLATVAPGVNVQGGTSSDTGGLRGALPDPAIELSGCTAGHDGVARLISRLRLMTGVVRVSLADSAEASASGASGGSGGGGAQGGCQGRHGAPTEFGIVVFFQPIPAVPAPTQPDLSGGGAGAAPAASAAPPAAPAGTATPAVSTTPATGTTAAPSAGSGPTGTAATTPSGTGGSAP